MTNLEFINKEIAITKSKYKQHLNFNQTAFAIKDEKRLQMLQRIKTILEAWEVVKRYTSTSEDVVESGYYFIKGLDDEYETIKKALEVEYE